MRLALCLLLFGCGRVGFEAGGFGTGTATDDGGPAGDGDQQGVPLCTTLAQFSYNFDGTGSALWLPTTDPGATMTESGNRLVIALPNNMPANAGYFSACTYDLRGQRVFVRAPVVPRIGTMTDMYLAVGTQANTIGVNVTRGSIEAYRFIGNNYMAYASVPYNAPQHQVWQIREAGGQVFWEVSADGTSFTSLHSGAPPFAVSAVQLLLFADAFTPVNNPGTAEFAKLNIL